MIQQFESVISAIEEIKTKSGERFAGTLTDFDYAEPYMLSLLQRGGLTTDDTCATEVRTLLAAQSGVIGEPEILVERVAMQMRIEGMRAQFVRSFDNGRWRRKECPFCGSLAGLGRIGNDGRRSLFCSFCWTEWDYLRQICPFCESEAGEYALFEVDGVDVRLEHCGFCSGYIKTLVQDIDVANPAYWDMKTLIADDWAIRHGYVKPVPHLTGINFFKIH